MTEGEVERLLADAATDPVRRPAFNDALLRSDVVVPGFVEGDVDGVAGPGTTMQLATTADADGPLTPFFTSVAALERWLHGGGSQDRRFVVLPCRGFLEMTMGARVALNLGSEFGKLFLPGEVEALLAGREPGVETHVVQAEQQVRVGAAANVPLPLTDVLTRFFAERPVEAVHLGWIQHPDGHAGYLLLVVAPDRDAAMAGFGALDIGNVTGGHTIDVMVHPDTSDPLLASVPRIHPSP